MTTIEATNAIFDEFAQFKHRHAMVLLGPGNLGSFDFSPGARFTGTLGKRLTLTAEAVGSGDPGLIWDVEAVCTEFVEDVDDPKKELKATAYTKPVDPDSWRFYRRMSGILTGRDKLAGARLDIEQFGSEFQLGPGANGKNAKLGAACWFSHDVKSQPDDPAIRIPPSQAPGGDQDGDFNLTCVYDQIRTQGFWGSAVCGNRGGGGQSRDEIKNFERQRLPVYAACIGRNIQTFAGITDVCAEFDFRPNDKCEQAEAQFMALLLNLYSGRVNWTSRVRVPHLDETTVGAVIEHIDGLLTGARSRDDCVQAQAIADAINNADQDGVLIER